MKKIKEEFKRVGKILFLTGLNDTHSGNMSLRVGKRFFITRHGAMLGFLHDRDIVEVNLDNDLRDKFASSEVGVHRAIFKNTNALAIIHTHPLNAITISFKYNEIIPRDISGSYYLKKIPVIELKEPTASKEMEEKLPHLLAEYPVVIIRAHGAFSIGKTLEEALHLAHQTEITAEIIYKADILGINK